MDFDNPKAYGDTSDGLVAVCHRLWNSAGLAWMWPLLSNSVKKYLAPFLRKDDITRQDWLKTFYMTWIHHNFKLHQSWLDIEPGNKGVFELQVSGDLLTIFQNEPFRSLTHLQQSQLALRLNPVTMSMITPISSERNFFLISRNTMSFRLRRLFVNGWTNLRQTRILHKYPIFRKRPFLPFNIHALASHKYIYALRLSINNVYVFSAE